MDAFTKDTMLKRLAYYASVQGVVVGEAAAAHCAHRIISQNVPMLLAENEELENRLRRIKEYASTVTPIDSLAASLALRHIIALANGEE